jgi:putative FmdB family regulatory protein
MPLYEYKCDRCGKVFEVIQKFSDSPLVAHEECGGAVERLLSAPALQFKGSGWYVTDYARNGSGTSGGKTDAASGNTESKNESKGESKPAPKTESKSESKAAAPAADK